MKDVAYDTISQVESTHWWYRVRRGIAEDLLSIFVKNSNEAQLLDVGCGTGEQFKVLDKFGTAYGIDFSDKAVQYCRDQGVSNVSVGDATNIPHESNKFDAVLALDVLEHIEDDVAVMGEVNRVLKDGGVFIVFVPCFDVLRGYSDIMGEHYRRYTLPLLTERLRAAGFVIEKTSYFNFFLFLPILLVRFISRSFGHVNESENGSGTGFMNSVFYRIFSLERWWLRRGSFPFGVSALCVAKKTSRSEG